MRHPSWILPALFATALAPACGRGGDEPVVRRDAATAAPKAAKTSGGRARSTAAGFSGVGWSVAPDTEAAAREAAAVAVDGHKDVDLTFVVYTPQHDPARIIGALGAGKPGRRVIGMSSHDGVLTADGYHSAPSGSMGVLAMKVEGMATGIGGADFSEGTGADVPEGRATELALDRAIADAGKRPDEKPAMVLVIPTLRSEEKVLAALTARLGPDVPVIGGTAAGPSKDIDLRRLKEGLEWSAVVGDRVITSGVGLAVFYTPKPFGWAYGGGFQRSTKNSGVITDAEPRMIRTIDGRPALDVYDEWVGGGLKEAMARGENMLVWCALHPLLRNVSDADTTHWQFLHPHPNPNQAAEPGTLLVGANVAVGEKLSLGEGSWNILLNRFAQMPREAKRAAEGGIDPIAGLFFYCGGALETIPRDHRANMGYLVSASMGNELPWLGVFSWGEQGHVTGIGNLHGNEMASTLLFPTAR
jgi:hypothetical protein